MAKTSKMDLEHDVTVNGVTYAAGKDVEVPSDQAEDIKRMNEEARSATDNATTHHGAVPAPAYPEEATAQTPTRPLGAPHLRASVSSDPRVEDGDVVTVDDKGQETPVEDVEAEKAKFESKETEAKEDETATEQQGPTEAEVAAEDKRRKEEAKK